VLLPGMATSGVATCSLGRLPIALPTPDGPVEVMVRPEQIRIDSQANADAAQAQVLAVTYYGPDATVLVSLRAGAREVTTRVSGHTAPQPGAEVWLSVEGVVMAYPRIQPLANPEFLSTRRGAVARTIKEKQE
jgi:iron(III) transport system ATP-binding protein